MQKVVSESSPCWLWTLIVPPLCCTIPNTVASPSPVPLPAPLVVKNGSKICVRVASSIPEPVSRTHRHTIGPPAMLGGSVLSGSPALTSVVETVICPPSGIASRALMIRFMITCSICPGSAST